MRGELKKVKKSWRNGVDCLHRCFFFIAVTFFAYTVFQGAVSRDFGTLSVCKNELKKF
jgi:hypothetical protein